MEKVILIIKLNMRRISVFVVTLILMFNIGCSNTPSKDEQIITLLRDFYIAYNEVWENAKSYNHEEFKEKVFSLQSKYCSNKLQRKLKQYYESSKFDHDLLTNDFGGTNSEKFKSTLTIVKDTTKEESYIVSYVVKIKAPSTPREEKNVIHLTVINEEGNYKIDEVW